MCWLILIGDKQRSYYVNFQTSRTVNMSHTNGERIKLPHKQEVCRIYYSISERMSEPRVSQNSDIEHGPSQIRMNTVAPCLLSSLKHLCLLFVPIRHRLSLGRRGRLVFRDQEIIQVAPAALTSEIGVVCRGYQADRFGGARIEIARRVNALLNFVSTEFAFVIHDGVMRGLGVALQTRVGLEIKVKVETVKKKYVEFSWEENRQG